MSGPTLTLNVVFTRYRLSYSIPIMVAGLFAKWTGDRLYKGSLYDVQIRLNHYPYLQFDKSSRKMGDAFAADIMHPRLVWLSLPSKNLRRTHLAETAQSHHPLGIIGCKSALPTEPFGIGLAQLTFYLLLER